MPTYKQNILSKALFIAVLVPVAWLIFTVSRQVENPYKKAALEDAQRRVLLEIAFAIPEDWSQAFVNCEMQPDKAGGFEHDILGIYTVKSDGGLVTRELKANQKLVEALTVLNRASYAADKQYWTTCDLVLGPAGQYKINYLSGPPKRMNGILDHDSYHRFKEHLNQGTTANNTGAVIHD